MLAGTLRRSGDVNMDLRKSNALERSIKDVEEHGYGVRSVVDALSRHCASVEVPPAPFVLDLPNVMHLATDVRGVVSDGSGSLGLVASLHPSAAVCGTPTDVAMGVISEVEGMDRGRYAGPVGWLDARGDGEWGIALRCAEVDPADPARLRLFAGCGIVAGSKPADELAETSAKLVPMRDALRALSRPEHWSASAARTPSTRRACRATAARRSVGTSTTRSPGRGSSAARSPSTVRHDLVRGPRGGAQRPEVDAVRRPEDPLERPGVLGPALLEGAEDGAAVVRHDDDAQVRPRLVRSDHEPVRVVQQREVAEQRPGRAAVRQGRAHRRRHHAVDAGDPAVREHPRRQAGTGTGRAPACSSRRRAARRPPRAGPRGRRPAR